MPDINTTQLLLVTDYVTRRMRRLAPQADIEADHTTSSIGFVGTSTDAAVSGGSPSSIVERTAASKELAAVRRWEQAKQRWARAVQEMDHAITALVPADEADWQPPGSGECQACSRWVSGSATDRIRSGLCDACRKWVRRTMERDQVERGEAMLQRRRSLQSATVEDTVGSVGTAEPLS
jgi:hypothetical protein